MSGLSAGTSKIGLYSPPQINRRLPKKEPRPQKVKTMTIAAGFRCHDGVVLCTDSEHYVGQSKFYQKKIFEAKAKNALLYIAGAGHDDYIKSAAESIETEITEKIVSLDQIKAAFQEIVLDLYRTHFAPSRQANDPNSPSMALLLAVKVSTYGMKPHEAAEALRKAEAGKVHNAMELKEIKEELEEKVANYHPGEPQAMLYRVSETGGISSIDDDTPLVVTGTETSEALMRELAALFFRDYEISVYAMRILAVHLVHRVVRFATYCGGSAQVACLADGCPSYLENSASPDVGQDWLGDIFMDLPSIVACCLSGEDSGHSIAVLEERVKEAAQKRKKFLGEHHPAETDGWLW
jgi:hypothetical protein